MQFFASDLGIRTTYIPKAFPLRRQVLWGRGEEEEEGAGRISDQSHWVAPPPMPIYGHG